MNPLKKTFIHRFTNGNQCTMVMDYTGERPKITRKWITPPDFSALKPEIEQWMGICATEFLSDQSDESVVRVLAMNAMK